ncbi:hypothetical protein PHLGIDRAFT_115590 [Phlebiopsis gigantea 11061_1 CR5-6]|uniref:Uncharacterized protein n=1 Tax=Phlebiopsis gigantea (strain 11061_1 CR5-6) TaxID=745531 RepID=A0A0C3SE96_PHLG1|nr:hypothetical protein PHLGIDRAFT_115590 [Phlebiopsis gigantea 11061_1 CR5-6]
MPLASSGLRALRVHQPYTLGQTGRSIHTPAFLPRPAQLRPGPSGIHAIFKQARTFLSTVVGHLTAPGALSSPSHASSASRSMLENAHAHRFPSIQQRLSSSTRFALARPLGAPYLPRGPTMPRNMFQVGLGTARNFSTARPIFDNLAQNVPVTGRAFWGADWDLTMQEERKKLRMQKYQKKQEKQTCKEMLQPVRAARQSVSSSEDEAMETETRAELNHYFPAPIVSEITTYLLIPLAPTPTSRLPLPMSPSIHTSNHPLIPFAQLASLHNDHNTHALRVSTMFARLDAARVFEEPGVSTSAYGDPSGLATILEVKFTGWDESRVRSVLGEAGTGWCVLEEVRETDNDALDDTLSELSIATGCSPTPVEPAIDPSASFVLPTLDFSASFTAERDSWARSAPPPTLPPGLVDLGFHNAWSAGGSDSFSDFSDSLSDVDVESESSWGGSLAPSRRPSAGSVEDDWMTLGFSSRFSGQMANVGVTDDTGARFPSTGKQVLFDLTFI